MFDRDTPARFNYFNVPTFVSCLLACNPETTILPPR